MPESPVDLSITPPGSIENLSLASPQLDPAPWPILDLPDVARAASSGDLLDMTARRVAQLNHALEEMQVSLPIEIRGFWGHRIVFTPGHRGEVMVEASEGRGRIRIEGMSELRAYAAVLNAFVAAFDAHAALADVTRETATLLTRTATMRGAV